MFMPHNYLCTYHFHLFSLPFSITPKWPTIPITLMLKLNVQLCDLRDRGLRKHYELQQVIDFLLSISLSLQHIVQLVLFYRNPKFNLFTFVWFMISQPCKWWTDKRPKVQPLHQESGINVVNITIKIPVSKIT